MKHVHWLGCRPYYLLLPVALNVRISSDPRQCRIAANNILLPPQFGYLLEKIRRDNVPIDVHHHCVQMVNGETTVAKIMRLLKVSLRVICIDNTNTPSTMSSSIISLRSCSPSN
jgi:hypothetical protein